MKRPYLLEFIRDFGDAVGGFILGYGYAINMMSYVAFGSGLILLTIFLRFYNK